MGSDWTRDDGVPYETWLAQMEAKYGEDVVRAIVGYTPRPRKNSTYSWAKHGGQRRAHIRGNAERADAQPEAVDFRHHKARLERGR